MTGGERWSSTLPLPGAGSPPQFWGLEPAPRSCDGGPDSVARALPSLPLAGRELDTISSATGRDLGGSGNPAAAALVKGSACTVRATGGIRMALTMMLIGRLLPIVSAAALLASGCTHSEPASPSAPTVVPAAMMSASPGASGEVLPSTASRDGAPVHSTEAESPILPGDTAPESISLSVSNAAASAAASTCAGYVSQGNPYPCCTSGNCTWGAWYLAALTWGVNLPAWGNAMNWANSARTAGFLVDTYPSKGAIGVSTTYVDRDGIRRGHMGYVLIVSGGSVTTQEMACDTWSGFRQFQRASSYFPAGYIRAPIPVATLKLWNATGPEQVGNGGTRSIRRAWFGAPVTVWFTGAHSVPNSSAMRGWSWTINGAAASTASMFQYTFKSKGSYAIVLRVTNSAGVTRTASAWVNIA